MCPIDVGASPCAFEAALELQHGLPNGTTTGHPESLPELRTLLDAAGYHDCFRNQSETAMMDAENYTSLLSAHHAQIQLEHQHLVGAARSLQQQATACDLQHATACDAAKQQLRHAPQNIAPRPTTPAPVAAAPSPQGAYVAFCGGALSYGRLMAAIDVATALVDDAGTIVFANARFANRVASSKVAAHGPSLVGAKLTDVVARVEADALSVVEALKRALEPATPPEGVEWIRRPSNDPSHARALAVAVSRAPCEADAPRRRRLASVYVGDAKVPPASLPAPRLLGPPVSKVSVAKTPRSDHDVDFNYFPSDLVEDSRREPKRRRNNEAAKAPKRTQDKAPPRDAAAPKASAAPKAKREAKPRAKALSADAPEADAPPPPPTTTRGGRTVRRTTKS